VEAGIIEEHYPLHRTRAHEQITGIMDKYLNKLSWRLFKFGNWCKYLDPIHMVKRYYGEKFAFYFMFFVHYQALLWVPAIIGMCLFGYQMSFYAWYGNMDYSLDTAFNGAFGLFISIWASVFVESWRVKEKTLAHKWDLTSDTMLLMNDERDGKFMYTHEYNSDTNTKLKVGHGSRGWLRLFNMIYSYSMVGVVIGVLFFFEGITYDEVEQFDVNDALTQYA